MAGAGGSLLGYRYESYDQRDVDAHLATYLQHDEPWAILDHDKPGLGRAQTARSAVFYPFERQPPDFAGGIRFNLHNNKWGTNFPMWWEGDFTARFVVRVL